MDIYQLRSIHTSDILMVLSDDKSLALFNIIAFNFPQDTAVLITRLGFTRKQYYLRMNRLIDVCLVRRKSGKYSLTTLGRVVQESHKLIGHAIENYWKLKAIDSIEASDRETFYKKRKRIIDALIERNDIKSILLNQIIPSDKIHKLVAVAATTHEIL